MVTTIRNLTPRARRRLARLPLLCASLAMVLVCSNARRAHATPNEVVLGIDSGQSAFTSWFWPDGSVSGGSAGSTANTIDTSAAYFPAPMAVYRTFRTGASTYTLSGLTASARYNVRLHFADPTSTGPNQRRFNVAISGAPALANYDIFADAGAINRAVVKPFNATANASGQITVQLTNVTGSALISAIDVLPNHSYFIDAGTTSGMAGAYAADQFSSGGTVFSTASTVDTSFVPNPAPQKVYQSERRQTAGNLSYTIPNLVPNQLYDVRLHFAEIDPSHGSVGARKFHVKANGMRVLFEYDPFDAGGALFVATARSFEVAANASGQIVVLLERVVSNPTISAIEVRPQIAYKFNAGGFVNGGFDNDHWGYLVAPASTSVITTSSAIARPANPPGFPVIPYAPEAVYQSARRGAAGGTLSYELAGLQPNKLYRVRLHFAEIDAAYGQLGGDGQPLQRRVFTVKINNSRVFPHFDIFAAAGNTLHRAILREATFSAGPNGVLALQLEAESGAPIVNGIEVERDAPAPGYFASDVGMQQRLGGAFVPSSVFGVDGGASALVGNNVLWAYGDTLYVDHSVTPTVTRGWTNTGALSSKRDLTHVLEVTGASSGPAGQLVPWLQAQQSYNQTHHGAFGCVELPTPAIECDGSYYAIWPGSIIRQADGSGLVFSGIAMIFGSPTSPPGQGVITHVQQPGTWPTNATLPSGQSHNTLFPHHERLFIRGFLAPDGHVYMYRSEAGQMAKLSQALSTAAASISQLPLVQGPQAADGLWPSALSDAVMAGQQLELISGANRQIVTVAASVGPGPATNPVISVAPFKANFDYPADSILQHVGAPIGRLSAALTAGVARTSITLANPLPVGLLSGQKYQFWANDAGGVQRVQVVTTSAAAAAGATTIDVQPFTPAFGYAAGTPVHQTVVDPAPFPFNGLWNVTYVARAPLASAATRSAWTFWNQKLNNDAGGWDASIGNNTPMLYSDASFGWMDAPDVQWNPYLNKYLVVRALALNDGVYVSSSTTPQGPWPRETLATRLHTHESYAGAYFMNQHPETQLGNGQTIHVTFAAAGPGPSDYTGGVRVVRLTLP